MILAVINVYNYRDYKRTGIKLRLSELENELLKFKLNDCEQRGTKCNNQPGTE